LRRPARAAGGTPPGARLAALARGGDVARRVTGPGRRLVPRPLARGAAVRALGDGDVRLGLADDPPGDPVEVLDPHDVPARGGGAQQTVVALGASDQQAARAKRLRLGDLERREVVDDPAEGAAVGGDDLGFEAAERPALGEVAGVEDAGEDRVARPARGRRPAGR
jgi:hypothetical protein